MLGRARALGSLGKFKRGKVWPVRESGRFSSGIELAKGLFMSLKTFLLGEELGDTLEGEAWPDSFWS